MPDSIRVKLSSCQESAVGKALGHLYYSNSTLCSLAPNRSGYPHNGGEHTLDISGDSGECSAFIELMIERYPQAADQFQYVLSEIKVGNRRIDINNFDMAAS
jgi:hypothetical protein